MMLLEYHFHPQMDQRLSALNIISANISKKDKHDTRPLMKEQINS